MINRDFIIILCLSVIGFIQTIKQEDTMRYIKPSFVQATLGDCRWIKKSLGVTYEKVAIQANLKLLNAVLKLYTDKKKISYSLINSNQGIMQSSHFNLNLSTIIISHGYLGNAESVNIVKLANEIKSIGDANVLTFDHSSLTNDDYFIASTNAQYAGEALGAELAKMYSKGARNFHLIGLSLGAHVSGFAGKVFQKKLKNVKIDRITGLDPAGPCYFKENSDKMLTKTDANFVDSIHTSIGTFGISIPVAHIDFFPNGGIDMPGCWTKLCSHIRSLLYYIESVKNRNGFLAVKCIDWQTFQNGGCMKSGRTMMGFWMTNDAPAGSYFFKTLDMSPFTYS